MTLFFNALHENYLGYSAIFSFVSVGFFFLRRVDRNDAGPGYWALSFIFNGLGFLLWSGIVPIAELWNYLIGEIFHISGFFFLICGAYRFSGNKFHKWHIIPFSAWIIAWIFSIMLVQQNPYLSSLMLKGLRSLLFISAGIIILNNKSHGIINGKKLAGWSLISWGFYVVFFAFIKVNILLNLAFGFLVAFQILAAFGMVAMIVDKIRLRAEDSEALAKKLEGLLPICSYCKKIRDETNSWQTIESYIEDRSKAEFSHGICPDCLKKHFQNI